MKPNELTTNLYAANLCDEAIAVQKLIDELAALKTKLKSQKPICPICLAVLEPFNYKGYYDSHSGYECNCTNFAGIADSRGAYA